MSTATDNTSLDTQSFQTIAEIAYADSGLQLVSEKTSMIQSRLRKRLKVLGLKSFSDYSDYIRSDAGKSERRHMISALTTNVSHFFREQHHFDILHEQVSKSLLPAIRTGSRLRIWSAGSSNGQEAYSIAMTLCEIAPEIMDCDVRILATDIDPQVVDFAISGVYPERMMNGVSPNRRSRFFDEELHSGEKHFSCKPSLRKLVRFRELNLLANWPMKNHMDFIFCRNVVIYFNAETQNRLWARFHNSLSPQGMVFLGHSERIPDPESYGFESVGPTTYAPIGANDHF